MKALDFRIPDGAERYEILYDGLVGSNRGLSAPSETRIMSRILDKLEAIGIPVERGTVKTFSLVPEVVEMVLLEDTEWRLMVDCLQTVKWTTRAARKATTAMEWLEAATEPVKEEHGSDTPK